MVTVALRALEDVCAVLRTRAQTPAPEALLRQYRASQPFRLRMHALRALFEHHLETEAAQEALELALGSDEFEAQLACLRHARGALDEERLDALGLELLAYRRETSEHKPIAARHITRHGLASLWERSIGASVRARLVWAAVKLHGAEATGAALDRALRQTEDELTEPLLRESNAHDVPLEASTLGALLERASRERRSAPALLKATRRRWDPSFVEPLWHIIRSGSHESARLALRMMGERGGPAQLAPLGAFAEITSDAGLHHAARHAHAEIFERSGGEAMTGQLTLSQGDDQAGGLSVAGEDGTLSMHAEAGAHDQQEVALDLDGAHREQATAEAVAHVAREGPSDG